MARLAGRDRNGENDVADDAQDQKVNSRPHLAPYQFKKGQSGNPGGRPKGRISFVAELQKALLETPNGDGRP